MKDAVTPEESRQAAEDFEAERSEAMKFSQVKDWEEGRKKDLVRQKSDWKKRLNKAEVDQYNKPFKSILNIGTFYGGIKPMPGYLIVLPDDNSYQTDSGLYIASTETREANTGTVKAVGERVPFHNGHGKAVYFDPPVEVGDRIIFKRGIMADLTIDNKDHKLMQFTDCLGKFEK